MYIMLCLALKSKLLLVRFPPQNKKINIVGRWFLTPLFYEDSPYIANIPPFKFDPTPPHLHENPTLPILFVTLFL